MFICCAKVATTPEIPEEVIEKWGEPEVRLCEKCLQEIYVAPRSCRLKQRFPEAILICNACAYDEIQNNHADYVYGGETPDVPETSH